MLQVAAASAADSEEDSAEAPEADLAEAPEVDSEADPAAVSEAVRSSVSSRFFLISVIAGIGGGGGGTTVQKHIYVHVPPPEPEEFRPQRPISVGQAQKHYKIIFIKAPSAPTPTAPVIPLQPQNEEKTLVYVLVKKPEDAPEINIPTPAPTQPSKPEVYFIRYKTQVN